MIMKRVCFELGLFSYIPDKYDTKRRKDEEEKEEEEDTRPRPS